jgi:membrane protein
MKMTALSAGSGKNPRSILQLLKQTGIEWMNDKAMRLSAALALYAIVSLAPLLVITVKVVGVIWRNKAVARTQVMDQMTSLMGAQAAKGIEPLLNSTSKPGSGVLATTISVIVLIFSATGVFVELEDSMNTIWHVKPKPGHGIWEFIKHRLLSLAMVFGMAFLLLVSMFVSALLAALARSVAGNANWLVLLLDVIVSFVVVSLIFAGVYKFLPEVDVQWSDVWHAAIGAGLLFTLGKYGLGLYFKYSATTSAFGAAGSLVAVLLWVYYSSFILFFGAEFTKVWAGKGEDKMAQA